MESLENTGQVCVAPNRIFVHESVLDEFMAGVNSFMDEIKLGSGNDEGKHLVGPLVNEKALHNMESLVEDAVSKGAKIYRGGKRAEREGFFYEPTCSSKCRQNNACLSGRNFWSNYANIFI